MIISPWFISMRHGLGTYNSRQHGLCEQIIRFPPCWCSVLAVSHGACPPACWSSRLSLRRLCPGWWVGGGGALGKGGVESRTGLGRARGQGGCV